MVKYGLVAAVILSLVGLVNASPVGVYYNEDFVGTSLNASLWGGNAMIGKKVQDKFGSIIDAPGYVAVDGWAATGELIGQVKAAPAAGQTVILTATEVQADAWPAGLGWGLEGIQVEAGNWAWSQVPSYSMVIGSQRRSGIHDNAYMTGDWTLTWSPTQITLVSGIWGTIFDSNTMAPDGGGTWTIPTTEKGFYSYNYYQGDISFGGLKMEVVPEPATLALLSLGLLGLLRKRG